MLAMKPSGAKSWMQRIVVQGRRTMGLGSFEFVTLAEARDAAFANRRIARRRRRPSAPTFAEAAAHVIDAQPRRGRRPSRSRAEWESSLAAYASHLLGDLPVDAIARADVMRVVTPILGGRSARPRAGSGRGYRRSCGGACRCCRRCRRAKAGPSGTTGEDRAPGAAVATLPGRPRRGAEPSPNGRGGRSRLSERPRPPTPAGC